MTTLIRNRYEKVKQKIIAKLVIANAIARIVMKPAKNQPAVLEKYQRTRTI